MCLMMFYLKDAIVIRFMALLLHLSLCLNMWTYVVRVLSVVPIAELPQIHQRER